ncbi:MAG: nicotinamide-nucleotide amidohydrolase family protein [Actinobacteria bacterium]|nr:nicotinamide-nucleotide amidohydrolase family protein [Actinomycetota bacterium]
MRCEVIAVGTELLLGQIVDTNSSWIGEQLALAGVDSHFQTKVGDNVERIASVLRIALDRSDAVIVCGGLGPTHDDVTREAIAEVMGVGLVRDASVVARIEAMFSARGRRMPDNNLRQADIPEGAAAIDHPQPGTAPGLVCPIAWPGGGEGDEGASGPGGAGERTVDKVVYAVPGVPHEMRAIVEQVIVPDLRRRAGDTSVILSRTLRTWGESESGLAERLAERIRQLDEIGNPTLAFLASGVEGLKVRVTAKGPDEASCKEVLGHEELVLRALLGDLVFGVDDETMEIAVGALLDANRLSLGLAESVTGGLVGARLTAAPGASAWFRGSIVSYASEVKFDLLDVPEGPVVTAEAAEAMAAGARRVLDADVGLSVTGVAGPAAQDGEEPGTVYVGLALGDQVESVRLRLPGDRERVRQFACISALDVLRHRLSGSSRGGHLGERTKA